MPKVFIADASPLDCQLLAASLLRSRIQVAGWATKSADVRSVIARCKPDIAVVGVRLEDGQRAGLDALHQLKDFVAESPVVMLLDADDPAVVIEAFRNGASGVFTREQMSSGLAKCLRCVMAGQLWASNKQMGYLVHRLRQHSANTVLGAKSTEVLTRRERQVGKLVARGLTNRDIAEELGLSEHTVKNYLLVMFEKLNVSTRVELALLFVGSSEARQPSGGPEAEGDAAIPA